MLTVGIPLSCLSVTGLLDFEANAALVAGANIMLSSGTTAAICQLQALSPVGRCRTFDDRYVHHSINRCAFTCIDCATSVKILCVHCF